MSETDTIIITRDVVIEEESFMILLLIAEIVQVKKAGRDPLIGHILNQDIVKDIEVKVEM